jgi:4-diphosphocytidyl-2-C-methyl-D-erythritol kinase
MTADGRVAAQARAKVNLFLEVTGKRADGYHDIDSVFAEIDLADTLRARVPAPDEGAADSITLICDDSSLPTDESNLVVRAAYALREYCAEKGMRPKGLELRLEKRIPSGGGLGGGSSDAATTLRLADKLWECGLSETELHTLAETLGSDVPFFLRGGVCRCRGRGEIIEPLPPLPTGVRIGLSLPEIAVSTAEAYRNLTLPLPGAARTADAFIAAMAAGDLSAMRAAAFNRFEATVFRDHPALGAAHAVLETELGHSARLSGSGSTLWYFTA